MAGVLSQVPSAFLFGQFINLNSWTPRLVCAHWSFFKDFMVYLCVLVNKAQEGFLQAGEQKWHPYKCEQIAFPSWGKGARPFCSHTPNSHWMWVWLRVKPLPPAQGTFQKGHHLRPIDDQHIWQLGDKCLRPERTSGQGTTVATTIVILLRLSRPSRTQVSYPNNISTLAEISYWIRSRTEVRRHSNPIRSCHWQVRPESQIHPLCTFERRG